MKNKQKYFLLSLSFFLGISLMILKIYLLFSTICFLTSGYYLLKNITKDLNSHHNKTKTINIYNKPNNNQLTKNKPQTISKTPINYKLRQTKTLVKKKIKK